MQRGAFRTPAAIALFGRNGGRRDVALDVAVWTSIRVVAANLGPMLLWGLIVAGSLLIGSIPAFLGLCFRLAHAWARHLAPIPQGGGAEHVPISGGQWPQLNWLP